MGYLEGNQEQKEKKSAVLFAICKECHGVKGVINKEASEEVKNKLIQHYKKEGFDVIDPKPGKRIWCTCV